MSTLCFLGIEILEAVKGRGLFFIELEILVARLVFLLPGRVGVCFVFGSFVPEGRVRSVVGGMRRRTTTCASSSAM